MTDYICLNFPTRKPFSALQQNTSPGITWTTPDLALESSWHTLQKLSSDHLPIIIQLFPPTTKLQKKKTYINYKKARWELFEEHTVTHLANFNIENFDLNRCCLCSLHQNNHPGHHGIHPMGQYQKLQPKLYY